MGRKSRKKKQIKQQKYIKKKQEQNISFEKKLALRIEKIARYISMIIYVIVCMFLLGGFYQLEITPEFLEETLGVIALMVAVGMFFVLFDTIWPSRESEKDKKRKQKRKRSSYSSNSSSGFVNYSDNDCSSSGDSGGGDCGGGGD